MTDRPNHQTIPTSTLSQVRGENNIPHVVVSGMVTLSGDIPQSPPDPEAPGRVDTSDTFLGTPSRAEAVGTNMNEVVAMAPDGPSHKVKNGLVTGRASSAAPSGDVGRLALGGSK